MTSNDNGKNAFTSDEATKIICTALTNGSLVLPLNKKLQDLGLVQFVKLCAGKNVINDEDDVEEVLRQALIHWEGEKLAACARADALYLLALRKALTEGITEKEAQRILFSWG